MDRYRNRDWGWDWGRDWGRDRDRDKVDPTWIGILFVKLPIGMN